jgi:hypothetical protein
MTPKEKAEELISSYRFALSIPNAPLGENKDSIAKQSCLIAVDELIKSHYLLNTTHDIKPSIRCKSYWKEVKEEIEKL